ncbi:MAG TPA: sensor domain-containing diguanylate cyclase [Thermomicrobiales bacterium]|nr:sensor domain-containing diguanylate cyclase [Thermomicrobiales bacterium]
MRRTSARTSPPATPRGEQAWRGHDSERALRLELAQLGSTLGFALLLATLAWVALPGGPSAPPPVVAAGTLLALLTVALIWLVPWLRLPAWSFVPVTIVGVALTAVPAHFAQGPMFYGLFFYWVGGAAFFYRAALGLPLAVLVAALEIDLALAAGLPHWAPGQVALQVLSLLLIYGVCRTIAGHLSAFLHDAATARQAAARLAALYDLSTLLSTEHDLGRLLSRLVHGLAEMFGYRYVSTFLLDDGGLRLMAQVGYETPITALALGEGITGLVAQQGRPLLVRDGGRHPRFLRAEAQIGSQASVPLLYRERVIGVLNLEGRVDELTEDDLRLLETLAAPAAIAIENAMLLALLEEQARRDPLTGLLNRRGIIAALERALPGDGARAADGAPVTILLVDLNGFKAVNDRYGHATGDALLVELTALLAGSVRAEDAVGRLGGDEFLVVMPGADEYAAGLVVERLADVIAAHQFAVPDDAGDEAPPAVGYSLGVATAPEDGADVEALLLVADRAMYLAKRSVGGPIRFLARERAAEAAAVGGGATEEVEAAG